MILDREALMCRHYASDEIDNKGLDSLPQPAFSKGPGIGLTPWFLTQQDSRCLQCLHKLSIQGVHDGCIEPVLHGQCQKGPVHQWAIG